MSNKPIIGKCNYCLQNITITSTEDIECNIKFILYFDFNGKSIIKYLCPDCYKLLTVNSECVNCHNTTELLDITTNEQFTYIFKLCKECALKYCNIIKCILHTSYYISDIERYNIKQLHQPQICNICKTCPKNGLMYCRMVDINSSNTDIIINRICYACYAKILLNLQQHINICCCQYCIHNSNNTLQLCKNYSQQYTVLCKNCIHIVDKFNIRLNNQVKSSMLFMSSYQFNIRVYNIFNTLTNMSRVIIKLKGYRIIVNNSIILNSNENIGINNIGYVIRECDVYKCFAEPEKYFVIKDGKIILLKNMTDFVIINDLIIIKSNGKDDFIIY